METTKASDLPFNLNEVVRVKIDSLENEILGFIHRTQSNEQRYKIKIPKSKLWKNAGLKEGAKINLELITSPTSGRIQLTIRY